MLRSQRDDPCARIREELSLYDIGGLGFWRRRQVVRHLARCPECASELAALRRAASLLDELPAIAAPAGMWERLESAIDAAERQPALRPSVLPRLVPVGVAALLAAAVGVGVRRFESGPAPQPSAAAYARSHLALSQAGPFAPAAGWDIVIESGSYASGGTGGGDR